MSLDKPLCLRIPIIQYTMRGIYVKEFTSMSAAYDATKISICNISQACKGTVQTSAGGYRWTYSDINKIKKHLAKQRTSPVNMFDKNDNLIRTYSSISEASREESIRPIIISRMCKGITTRQRKRCYFRFVHSEDKDRTRTRRRPIVQLSLEGKLIANFRSSNSASKTLGISYQRILTACRRSSSTQGFEFRFAQT